MNVVSAHVVLGEDAKPGEILDHLGTCLADDFDVKHSTFQLGLRSSGCLATVTAPPANRRGRPFE